MDMSCFAKAATRRGGTARIDVAGRRTEDRERMSRTMVVCTLIFAVSA